MSEVHSGFRISVRKLNIGVHRTLLALVHGVDMRNYDTETRQSFAQELAREIQFVKEQQKNNKLILLGDFNMNPYERGMNLAAGLNAMMTKACVRSGTRRHLGKDYEFYYNPMWSLFGDIHESPAGTVYDTSNQGPYGWSMLDQVLFNHSIVDLLADVKILTTSGLHSLMDKNGRPDSRNASDHFPIMLTLRKEIIYD
jgi:exonuclease III